MKYHLNHLRELESESIFVLREVAAQFENPALLFSGGKDSILMTHLAAKAFYPGSHSLSFGSCGYRTQFSGNHQVPG